MSASATHPVLARDLDPVHARELEVVFRRRVCVHQPDLLAERLEGVRHRQLRSDRIAIGSCVRGQEETLPVKDFVADPVDDGCCRARFGRIASLGPLGHHELRPGWAARHPCPQWRAGTAAARAPARFLSRCARSGPAFRCFRRRRTAVRAHVGAGGVRRADGEGRETRAPAPLRTPGGLSDRPARCSRRARAGDRR